MTHIKKLTPCVVTFAFILLFSVHLEADENVLGLYDNIKYDIHLGSDNNDEYNIIRNVEIMKIKEIQGYTFLVIQTDDFAPKKSEGLIMLKYVRAVLPSFKSIKY